MSKNIQFQKVMVNGMIIEMGCNNLGCLVIGRMLNRCEGINLFTMGHNNDTAGMLTGCTSDTDASADPQRSDESGGAACFYEPVARERVLQPSEPHGWSDHL